jgi:hypothetical protein
MRFFISSLLYLIAIGCLSAEMPKSSSPFAKYIQLSGNITPSLTYVLKVRYSATSNDSKCQRYHSNAGKFIAKTHQETYSPIIDGMSHEIKLPLQEVEPNTHCQWKSVGVMFCGFKRGEKPNKCTSLYAFNGQHHANEITMECSDRGWCFHQGSGKNGLIDEFNKEYVFNVLQK